MTHAVTPPHATQRQVPSVQEESAAPACASSRYTERPVAVPAEGVTSRNTAAGILQSVP